LKESLSSDKLALRSFPETLNLPFTVLAVDRALEALVFVLVNSVEVSGFPVTVVVPLLVIEICPVENLQKGQFRFLL
jgi:hypothetical protein